MKAVVSDEERSRLLEHFYQEAVQEPMDYFSHDVNTFDDDAYWSFFDEFGYAGLGKFWRLVELLSAKKGHSYRVEDRRLAHEMYLTQDELSELIDGLLRHGLLDKELYEDGRISSKRVQANAEIYATKTAKARLGAEVANRKRIA